MIEQDQIDADTEYAAQYAAEHAKWMESVVAAWRTGAETAAKAAGEWQALGDQMARLAEWPGQMLPGLPHDAPDDDFEPCGLHIPDFRLPANALPDMFTAAMHTAYSIAGVYRRHVAKLTRALLEEARTAANSEQSESANG